MVLYIFITNYSISRNLFFENFLKFSYLYEKQATHGRQRSLPAVCHNLDGCQGNSKNGLL